MRLAPTSLIFLLLAASVAPARADDASLAELQPPPAGAHYEFVCVDMAGRAYQEEYRVTASSNDRVAVEVTSNGQQNTYEKPLYAMGTTVASKERIGGQDRSMSIPSSLGELRKLSPGGSYRPSITERRSGAKSITWNYNISVLGRELAYHREFGDLAVVVLNEDRWANLYSATMQTHLAMQLRFPVYWRYRDSNGMGVECRLATATGLGSVLVASMNRPAPPVQAPVQPAAVQTASAVASPPAAPARNGRPTAGTAAVAGAVAKAPAGAETTPQQRLDQLKELLQQKLITQQEYDRKEKEILGLGGGSIGRELEQANLLYREKKISQDEFMRRRAQALAKIAPNEMSPRDALVLLNQLQDAGLISATEHKTKREQMLSAL